MSSRRRLHARALCAVTVLFFVSSTLICGNALALPILLSAKGGSDTPTSGPSSGSLEHNADDYIETYSSKANEEDFIAEATFTNPYSTKKGSWDYGFLFRYSDEKTFHAIRVTSSRKWDHHVIINGKWNKVAEGSVSGLQTGDDQTNHLRIIVLGNSGAFYVNDQFVAPLDTRKLNQKGYIIVATGIFSGNEIEGEATHFEGFTVWSLETPTKGPLSGSLNHDKDNVLEEYTKEINVKDFIAEAAFINPYSTKKGSWDYGFLFRYSNASTFHAIRVTSYGNWGHYLIADGKWNKIEEGYLSAIRTGVGQTNCLRIIVLGNNGAFYVNDLLATSLDISAPTQWEYISVATGIFSGNEIEGEVTHFADFAIWSLNVHGSIQVKSSPTGTECYVDGAHKGTTPVTIADVTPGSHVVVLKKNNYQNWKRSVSVYPGRTLSVNATLVAKAGSLVVDASTHADVYVDGTYKGTTPLRIDNVLAGSHTVTVSAEKYYSYMETNMVEPGKTTYVWAELEKKPGSIYVESTPSGADVYLDESYKGVTPLTIYQVQEGTYTLTLRYPGYNDWTTSVTVNPDEMTTEQVFMRTVFWRTWYFVAGVTLAIAVVLSVVFLRRRKQSIPLASKLVAKSGNAFRPAPEIKRANPVSEESIKDLEIPKKENLCPICNESLNEGEIVECTHCKDKGLEIICKMHRRCWEKHKKQQKGKCEQGKVRCHTYFDICISEKDSIRSLP